MYPQPSIASSQSQLISLNKHQISPLLVHRFRAHSCTNWQTVAIFGAQGTENVISSGHLPNAPSTMYGINEYRNENNYKFTVLFCEVCSQFNMVSNLDGLNGTSESGNGSCYMLSEAHPAALVVHAVCLAMIIVFSFAGNGLVLLLVVRFKELRVRSTVVSLCLVVADLLLTLCYTFPAMVTAGTREWVFREAGCIAFGFLASDVLITRWLTLCLLCLDRFCSVRFPFSYTRRGKWPMIILACLAWFVPFVLSAVPVHVFTNFEVRDGQPTCLPTCQSHNLSNLCRLYYGGIFTATFIIGTIIPIILYSWLYHKGRRLRKSAKHSLGHHTVKIASSIVVLQHKEEQNSTREKQATITFALLFVAVMFTGMPGYLLQLARSTGLAFYCEIPIYFHFISTEVFLCASALTPLVIMRDQTFRACLAKLCCCRKKTSDFEIQKRGPSKSPSESKSFSGSRRSSFLDQPHTFQLVNGSSRSSVFLEPPNTAYNGSRRPSVLEVLHTVHEIVTSQQEKDITPTKSTPCTISESLTSESLSEC